MDVQKPSSASYKVFRFMHPEGWGGNFIKWSVIATLIGGGTFCGLKLLNKFSYLKGLNQLNSQHQLLAASLGASLPVVFIERVTGIWVRKQEFKAAERHKSPSGSSSSTTSSTGESSSGEDLQATIDKLRQQVATLRAREPEGCEDHKATIAQLEERVAELVASSTDPDSVRENVSRLQEELSQKEIARVQLQEQLRQKDQEIAHLRREFGEKEQAIAARPSKLDQSSGDLLDRSAGASQRTQQAIKETKDPLDKEGPATSSSESEKELEDSRADEGRPEGTLIPSVKRPEGSGARLQEIRNGAEEEADNDGGDFNPRMATDNLPLVKLQSPPFGSALNASGSKELKLEKDAPPQNDRPSFLDAIKQRRQRSDSESEEEDLTKSQVPRSKKDDEDWEAQFGSGSSSSTSSDSDSKGAKQKAPPSSASPAVGAHVLIVPVTQALEEDRVAEDPLARFHLSQQEVDAEKERDLYAFTASRPEKDYPGEPWRKEARIQAWNKMKGCHEKFSELLRETHQRVLEKALGDHGLDSFVEDRDFETCLEEAAKEMKIALAPKTAENVGDCYRIECLKTFLKRPEEIYARFEAYGRQRHEKKHGIRDLRHVKVSTKRRENSEAALNAASSKGFTTQEAKELADLEVKEKKGKVLTVKEKMQILELRQKKDQHGK